MKKNRIAFLFLLVTMSFFETKAISVTTSANFNNPSVCSGGVYSFVASPGLINYIWKVSDDNGFVFLTGSGQNFTINGGIPEFIFIPFPVANAIVVSVTAFNGVSTESWVSDRKNVVRAPILKLIEDASFCPNATVSLQNTTSPGSGSYSYSWFYNNNVNPFSSDPSITATAAGIYKLEITESISQCVASDEVVLQAQPAPVLLGANSPQFKCFGENYQFDIRTPTQLHWPITCNWSGANSPLAFSSSQNVLSLSSNTNPTFFAPLTPAVRAPTAITVEATNSRGCKTTAVINMVFNAPITGGITTPNNSILCKFGNYILDNDVAGGNGGFTYLWSPSDGLSDVTASKPTILPQSVDGTLYTLVAKDNRNCSVTGTVNIKKSTLNLTFKNHNSDNITRCLGAAIPIEVGRSNGVAGFTFSFSPGLIRTNDTIYTTPAVAGDAKYIVTVTDGASCTDKDSIVITAVPAPLSSLPSKNWCPRTPLQVDATPINITGSGVGFRYEWIANKADLSNDTAANPIINTSNLVENQAKQYSVKVSKADEPDCNATTTFEITGLPRFDLKIDRGILANELFIESSITFKSNGNGLDSLTWFFADVSNSTATGFETVHRYDSARVYIVTHSGFNNAKCLSVDTISVKVKRPSTRKIFIPNVFLPSSADAANSSFKIFCDDAQINTSAAFSAKVFNIYGKAVFETTNYQEMKTKGWTGEGFNSGTYSYIIEGQFADESSFKIPGSVTMIR